MNLIKVLKTVLIGTSISLLSAVAAFAGTTGIVIEDVNVYALSTDEDTVIGKLDKDREVTIIEEDNEWLKIVCADFSDVYIPSKFVSINSTSAIVTGDGVNVREQPSLDAPVLTKTDKDSNIRITAKVGEWYEVDYKGETAYIYGDYIDGKSLERLPEKPLEVTSDKNKELAEQIVDYAVQFLGTPYVYGASSLTKGTDCSGFTSSVMKNFGIKINRSSRDQINNGTRVSKNELKAGDLVFFNSGGKSAISHVGLYIGNGDFVHSSSVRTGGVIISNLNENYYANTYVGATRVI